jgi:2-keto-4-pentenoate hydratase/2-oxohepta-3-ene-1,7-dioic acid hydratase in catechol pathway
MTMEVRHYVRYAHEGTVGYGLLAGDTITPIRGSLFEGTPAAGTALPLKAVRLLWPCEPSKILAVGRNYKSHLGTRPAPARPELFYKPLSALLAPGGDIVIPADARNVHYEGELVLVIGR